MIDRKMRKNEKEGVMQRENERIIYHLMHFNKKNDNSLPVPDVFVIDQNGKIIYKFVDANYMNRIDIDELLQTL